MATGLADTNFDWQNFYVGHLTADITAGATDIFIDTIPTPTESMLVIDPDTPANTEVIFYNSKTATKVTTPANGRGYDGSTAVAHLTGTKVILAPVGDMFRYIRTLATTTPQGWTPLASAPNTVTANGNRSYTCVFNGVDYTSILSAGMRLKTTRTVAAPTQSTSLNGTNQFWSKTSPAGMTFTNNFVVSAWVKLTSYGSQSVIASRYNGTSGWSFQLTTAGQLVLWGFNAASANNFTAQAYQSLPLNKWVHVAGQLDMTTTSYGGTNSYIMIDGVEVPAGCARAGTNPTALVQAGNLEIGSTNGGTNTWPGKIAQVAIYSAKVTEATILASMHQSLAGTETSLISAYSFNGNGNDLNANANNLTANNAAAATNADSPFGGQADGTISSTLDYGIVTKTAFSTNTTINVQVPEGCTIPTSGGVSAVAYAGVKAPYGMPVQREKWKIKTLVIADLNTGNAGSTWYSGASTGSGSFALNIPIGEWAVKYDIQSYADAATTSSSVRRNVISASATTPTTPEIADWGTRVQTGTTSSNSFFQTQLSREGSLSLAAATPYYAQVWYEGIGGNARFGTAQAAPQAASYIQAENAYL